MIRSNGKADASHYRSVNREAFVCIAYPEVNVCRQNYCFNTSGSVERKTCVRGEGFPVLVLQDLCQSSFPISSSRKLLTSWPRVCSYVGAEACWALNSVLIFALQKCLGALLSSRLRGVEAGNEKAMCVPRSLVSE